MEDQTEIECPHCFGFGFVRCCPDLLECYHGGDGLAACPGCGDEDDEGPGSVLEDLPDVERPPDLDLVGTALALMTLKGHLVHSRWVRFR